MIMLPRRPPGRPSADTNARYQADLEAFCAAILELRSTVGFPVSSRGWCYILEEHGLGKGNFDAAQNVINECREGGLLPLNICSDDDTRSFDGLESLDSLSPEAQASTIVGSLRFRHRYYTPFSFWRGQDHYLQMTVEKIDLKTLFSPVCRQFYVPIANCRGWSDLNSRADMMRRFAEHQAEGRQCVLLYCGDHDPVGLTISDTLRSNMRDLAAAVGWTPDNLIIDRFGLNYDFIETQGLTWIDGLETGSGRRLDDPKHPDHGKPYVQDYLRAFGARKVEANALVVRPAAARELCRDAILRYLSPDAPEHYRDALKLPREELRIAIISALQEASRGEASP
jgi:hypothetical protein